MKKLFSIGLGLMFGASAFATGPLPLNSQLTGTVTFTNTGSTSVTNLFEPGFSYPPAFSAYLTTSPTNALPFTNTVTATNFIITIATSTNAGVFWVASPVATRVQYGTIAGNTFLGASPTTYTNTFATPFVYTPSVVVSGSLLPAATNNMAVVSSVSTTSFVLSTGNTNQTFYWQAVGPCATRAATGPASTEGVLTY